MSNKTLSTPFWQRRDRRQQRQAYIWWLITSVVLIWAWQLISTHTIWDFVWDAPEAGMDMLGRMVPPRWSYLSSVWLPLWDTINIATLGTVLGALIAIPIAFLAAHNTSPFPFLCRPLALLIIVGSRSVNSLIWAMLLVAVIGPGVLAGVLAIALRSIGFIGKLLYEAIEETDVRQVEAITATGASSLQVVAMAIVPQVMPAIVGTSIYRWDINIRESTVLGIVGAGGLGVPLMNSVNVLAWPQVTVIFIVILAIVLVSESLSGFVRARII